MTEQLNIAELRRQRDEFEERCRVLAADFLDAAEERDALKAKLAAMDLLLNNAERVVRDGIADRDAAESIAWDALGRPEGTHDTSNVQRLCEAHGALKATLAKHAESERAWCELATARGAKLAALVEAMEHIKDIMGGHDGCQGWDSPEDVWGIADKALAAAKAQP